MSAAGCLLTEDHLLCSVCLDVFTNPVSTPCGHNFCKKCIPEQLNIDAPFQCPLCQKMFYPKPELHVNTLISEMADMFRRSAGGGSSPQRAACPPAIRSDLCSGTRRTVFVFSVVCTCIFIVFSLIQHDLPLIQEPEAKKLKKPEENIQNVEMGIGLRVEEVQELGTGHPGCTETLRSLKESVDRGLDELKDLQRTTEQLVCELKKRRTEEELFSTALLEQTLAAIMKKETPKLLIRAELTRMQRYAVDVTLDPDTAYPKLILSDDGKQARCCDPTRSLSDSPKRFARDVYVLGKQSFSSGRFYFEVQVRGKPEWTIGVAKESINRKGVVALRPQFGYWAVWLRNGNEYRGLAGPSVRLSLSSAPEKVGVFVDYEEGLVSFYDVEAAALIYSFTGCTFTERLYPFFDPSLNDDGKNSAPLIITPVNHAE